MTTPAHKTGRTGYFPTFVAWTDWILDGHAVTYGLNLPSQYRWYVPNTCQEDAVGRAALSASRSTGDQS